MRRINKMIKVLTFSFLGILLLNCAGNEKEHSVVEVLETSQLEPSLYIRLGGSDGISSIVDDIIAKHLDNPVVSPQFAYLSNDPEKLAQVKQHTCDFLGAGTGGNEVYTGNDVPTTHRGMNITNAEFLSAIDDILFVLNEHGMSDQTKKDMLYILYSFKGQVIGL
jgi:hemoglobin